MNKKRPVKPQALENQTQFGQTNNQIHYHHLPFRKDFYHIAIGQHRLICIKFKLKVVKQMGKSNLKKV